VFHSPLITPMHDGPRLTCSKRVEQAARDARLAQALRDNLRRRKAQARAREAGGTEPDPGEPEGEPDTIAGDRDESPS
jgi:hypothetical protein